MTCRRDQRENRKRGAGEKSIEKETEAGEDRLSKCLGVAATRKETISISNAPMREGS